MQRQTWGRDAGHISRTKTVKRRLSIAYFICKIGISEISEQIFASSFYEELYQKLRFGTLHFNNVIITIFCNFRIWMMQHERLFCYYIHGTTFFQYFCCWCSFLKQSYSIWFVICVWKHNILLEILIICVKPHIFLISLLNIWPILPFYFVFDFCQKRLCRGSCHAFFDSPIQKK